MTAGDRDPVAGRRGGDDRGSASLELLGMLPLLLVVAVLVVTVAGAFFAVSETNDAVRQGVRAQSLGQDGCGAARAVLPGALDVRCRSGGGRLGTGSFVRLEVGLPVPAVVERLVPDLAVTREAVLP